VRNFVMTSEAVTIGHPDKLCDQISDAIVDGCLAAGQRTRLSAECALANGVVFLSIRSGEELAVDPTSVARQILNEAGYKMGPSGVQPTVIVDLSHTEPVPRSADGHAGISQMVTSFGYACVGTPERMPYPIWLAHRLCRAMDVAREQGHLPWISPDAQAQVAVTFADRRPVRLEALAVQCGTMATVSEDAARSGLEEHVIAPVLQAASIGLEDTTRLIVRPAAGPAGPQAHSGLTGRKSADDAYGSFIRRAGPALSGKAPNRIDRIANYAARHAARAIVEAGLAREIEVQLSYLIGETAPTSVEVDSYQSGTIADTSLSARLREIVDFQASAIAERMGLWDLPVQRGGRFYRDLAVYGHMGRDDLKTPWEDKALAKELA